MKPSNSTTESSHHIAFVVQEGITGWLTAVSFLILPLYIKGGYHHLIEDKAILYTFLTVPALIIAAVTALLRILSKASAAHCDLLHVQLTQGVVGHQQCNFRSVSANRGTTG